jgi:hypothetical protein
LVTGSAVRSAYDLCDRGAVWAVKNSEDQTPHWGAPRRLTTQLLRQCRQPSRAHPTSVIEGIDITHQRYRVRYP